MNSINLTEPKTDSMSPPPYVRSPNSSMDRSRPVARHQRTGTAARLLDNEQQLVGLDLIALGDLDRRDFPVDRGIDRVLHLHGFEDHQFILELHLVSNLYQDFPDLPRQGCGDFLAHREFSFSCAKRFRSALSAPSNFLPHRFAVPVIKARSV